MEKDAIIDKGLQWQEVEWDQFEIPDLVAVQRKVRAAIDAKPPASAGNGSLASICLIQGGPCASMTYSQPAPSLE